MFNSFFKIHNVLFTEKINMWIYYLSKVPLLGKAISDDLYRSNKVKIVIANIIRVFSFIFMFAGKFVYLIIMIGLPAKFFAEKIGLNQDLIELQIFFFLSFILGPLMNNQFVTNLAKDFCMINLMRFDAKRYYLSTIFFSYAKDLVGFFIVIKILGASLVETFVIVFALMAFKLIIQAMYLFANKVIGFHPSTKPAFILTLIFVPFILAYALPLVGISINIKAMLMNIYFIFLLVILTIIALMYLISYKKYTILAKKILAKDDIDKINSLATNAAFSDVAINDMKINEKSLKNDKHKDKQGIEYLNLKFIERHKKVMLNPIRKRVIGVLILFIATIVLSIFIPESKKTISEVILNSTGALVFILYIISIGEKTTKAFFFNCDNSLLRYPFYREPKIILDNFKARLKIVTIFNLVPALAIAISLSILMILTNGNLLKFAPIFISIISLSIFFTVHYLFLYYIAQPYTSQLTIKSPIYKFASVAIYVLAYAALQIRTASLVFTMGIIILTVTYIVISIFLVYKHAHKTFKLK